MIGITAVVFFAFYLVRSLQFSFIAENFFKVEFEFFSLQNGNWESGWYEKFMEYGIFFYGMLLYFAMKWFISVQVIFEDGNSHCNLTMSKYWQNCNNLTKYFTAEFALNRIYFDNVFCCLMRWHLDYWMLRWHLQFTLNRPLTYERVTDKVSSRWKSR